MRQVSTAILPACVVAVCLCLKGPLKTPIWPQVRKEFIVGPDMTLEISGRTMPSKQWSKWLETNLPGNARPHFVLTDREWTATDLMDFECAVCDSGLSHFSMSLSGKPDSRVEFCMVNASPVSDYQPEPRRECNHGRGIPDSDGPDGLAYYARMDDREAAVWKIAAGAVRPDYSQIRRGDLVTLYADDDAMAGDVLAEWRTLQTLTGVPVVFELIFPDLDYDIPAEAHPGGVVVRRPFRSYFRPSRRVAVIFPEMNPVVCDTTGLR